MQTKCDKCGEEVKKVGRLKHISNRGLTQRVCKSCKKKISLTYK
jgi:hypothetical protein